MDINNFLESNPLYSLIISCVISCIFSIIITWYFSGYIKKPLIRYKLSDPLDIGKGLSTIFTEFKIQIGDHTLTDNVKYIKGSFVNAHKSSIQPPSDKKYRTINLTFPDNSEIKGAKITGGSKSYYTEDIKVYFAEKNEENKDNQNTLPKNKISFELPDVFESKGRFDFASIYYDPINSNNEIKVSIDIPDVNLKIVENHKDISIFFRYSNLFAFIFSLFVSLVSAIIYLIDNLASDIGNKGNLSIFIIIYVIIITAFCSTIMIIQLNKFKKNLYPSNHGKDNQGKDSEA